MLFQLIRNIRGYVRIRVAGYSPERFLNACCHRGIVIWGLKPVTGAYEMNMTIEGFKQIKPVVKKTGTKVIVVRRIGLPFFLHGYKKRRFFFVGAVLCAALLFVLSRFIWSIDIRGNLTCTDETLLTFLASREVKDGMPIKQVDCSRIVKDIRKAYDDIIWVSASIQGTKLIIQIKENEDGLSKEEEQEEVTEPKDIVADYDCKIIKITPRKGIPLVDENQTVKKGDVLVSGQIPVANDAGETVNYQYQEAEADIQGETWITYSEKIPLTYEVKEYERVKKTGYFLRTGEYYFSLGGVKNKYEKWEYQQWEKQLSVGNGFTFPVFYGVRQATSYKTTEKSYEKTRLQEILTDKFNRYCEDLEKKGVEIIENDVKIYTGSQYAEAKGRVKVWMSIGETAPSELLPIAEKEEEQTGE